MKIASCHQGCEVNETLRQTAQKQPRYASGATRSVAPTIMLLLPDAPLRNETTLDPLRLSERVAQTATLSTNTSAPQTGYCVEKANHQRNPRWAASRQLLGPLNEQPCPCLSQQAIVRQEIKQRHASIITIGACLSHCATAMQRSCIAHLHTSAMHSSQHRCSAHLGAHQWYIAACIADLHTSTHLSCA